MVNPIRVYSMRGKRTQALSPGSGGSELTPEYASWLCRRAERLHDLAAMLKWANDWSGAVELERALWMETVKLATREKWKLPKEGRKECLRRLAGLAIAVTADPRRWQHDLIRAAWLDVSPASYSQTWAKRLAAVMNVLDEWCNGAYRNVQKNQAKEHVEGG